MRDLNLHIIYPSTYDCVAGQEYLAQWQWVLMQPPVFSVLGALAEQAGQELNCSLKKINFYDERTEKGDFYLEKIISAQKNDYCNLIFISCLTMGLSRAVDIARLLQKHGVRHIVFGGPGITLADLRTLKFLVENQISFNIGEGEETVIRIIADCLSNNLRPCYWQREYINFSKAPLPLLPETAKPLIPGQLAGLEGSRGCPHNCDFCCVTQLCGREMSPRRSRDPQKVVDWIAEAHMRGRAVMLTDDNSRYYAHRHLRKSLIDLNERCANKLHLFGQFDAHPSVIKETRDYQAMGFKSGFFGFESLDKANLAEFSKNHNKPELYENIVQAFNECDIVVHSGIMVGFSGQTYDSIIKEAQKFSQLIDLGYFYAIIFFPLTKIWEQGVIAQDFITWDPNYSDTRHFTRDYFTNMTLGDATRAFDQAQRAFFSWSHLKRKSPNRRIWRANVKNATYGRALVELGYMLRNRPYHLMMESFPKWKRVKRPLDSFRGFALTTEDLEKREQFLMSITK